MTELIRSYFPSLTPVQCEAIGQLKELYEYWNARINVISRKDMDNFYIHHVLHSMAIAEFIGFTAGTRIADIGTGGGFPGIPLAILFPDSSFTLVDSIGKKTKVVTEVAGSLGLKNVQVRNCRAEDLKEKYHFVVSRAVTTLPEFVGWTWRLVEKECFNSLENGILYLKGGDLEKEIKPLHIKNRIFDLSACFKEDFFETKKLVHLYR